MMDIFYISATHYGSYYHVYQLSIWSVARATKELNFNFIISI